MGIFRRVSDIISANVSDMVESFESPEIMLRQAIREVDAAVGRTAEAAARVIAESKMLENQLDAQRHESTDLHRRACEALRRGDEPAARRALSRRIDGEKLAAALDDQLTVIRSTAGRLRRQLDAMRVRRAEAEHKLHLVRARVRAAEAQHHLARGAFDCGAPEAGFSRFERVCHNIERFEAETDAFLELTGEANVDDDGASSDEKFEAQFEALKHECRAQEDIGHHGTP
jgi:phage shock protein A